MPQEQDEPIPWGSCLYRNPAVRQTTTVVFSAAEVWAMDQGLRRALLGAREPVWVQGEKPLTPQERALPRPSTTPPMWAQQPQRSKRDRRSTRRVK
jgi:hypothetical protein